MGEGSSWGLREVDSGVRSNPSTGSSSVQSVVSVNHSGSDANSEKQKRHRQKQAVWVTASGKRAKSRIKNSAKIKINRAISQMSAALRFREGLAAILAEMLQTAKEAVDENSTAVDRRNLNEKFAKLGRDARIFSERANPIPYVETDVDSFVPSEPLLVTDQVKALEGAPAVSGDGSLVTFIHTNGKVIQKDINKDSEAGLGSATKATRQTVTSMNGEVTVSSSKGMIRRRFRSESDFAELAEAPPEEEITAVALSQDGSTVIYTTTQHDAREKLSGYDVRSVKTRSMTTNKVDYVEKGEVSELQVSSDGGYLVYLATSGDNIHEVIVSDMDAQYSERFEAHQSSSWQSHRIVGISDQGQAFFVAPSESSSEALSLYRFTIKTIMTEEFIKLPSGIVLNSLSLGNDGLSLYFFVDAHENRLVLYRADLIDGKLVELGTPENALRVDPNNIVQMSPDGQTVFFSQDEHSLYRVVMCRSKINMGLEATLSQEPVKQAVQGVESALCGIGGFVLSSRVTADDSLKRIQQNQSVLRESVRQLNEGLNNLQELYTNLSSKPKDKDGVETQINDFESASTLSKELFQRIVEEPNVALEAQSMIEAEIAFALFSEGD